MAGLPGMNDGRHSVRLSLCGSTRLAPVVGAHPNLRQGLAGRPRRADGTRDEPVVQGTPGHVKVVVGRCAFARATPHAPLDSAC